MSTTSITIPDTGLEVTSMIDGVEANYYESMFAQLDEISKLNADKDADYRQARYVVANYIYLIVERLQKSVLREIDYDQVKSWASKNRKLANYILSKRDSFPLEAFEKWITPEFDLITAGMYRPSNRFTKDIYH